MARPLTETTLHVPVRQRTGALGTNSWVAVVLYAERTNPLQRKHEGSVGTSRSPAPASGGGAMGTSVALLQARHATGFPRLCLLPSDCSRWFFVEDLLAHGE